MSKRTRDESPQKQAMLEMMQQYLKNNDICVKDGQDIKAIMWGCRLSWKVLS